MFQYRNRFPVVSNRDEQGAAVAIRIQTLAASGAPGRHDPDPCPCRCCLPVRGDSEIPLSRDARSRAFRQNWHSLARLHGPNRGRDRSSIRLRRDAGSDDTARVDSLIIAIAVAIVTTKIPHAR